MEESDPRNFFCFFPKSYRVLQVLTFLFYSNLHCWLTCSFPLSMATLKIWVGYYKLHATDCQCKKCNKLSAKNRMEEKSIICSSVSADGVKLLHCWALLLNCHITKKNLNTLNVKKINLTSLWQIRTVTLETYQLWEDKQHPYQHLSSQRECQ